MPRHPLIPQFTPEEARAWQALVELGDAARWGLHLEGRLAAARLRLAHLGAVEVAKHLNNRKI